MYTSSLKKQTKTERNSLDVNNTPKESGKIELDKPHRANSYAPQTSFYEGVSGYDFLPSDSAANEPVRDEDDKPVYIRVSILGPYNTADEKAHVGEIVNYLILAAA